MTKNSTLMNFLKVLTLLTLLIIDVRAPTTGLINTIDTSAQTRSVKYSPDGKFIAYMTNAEIGIIDSSSLALIFFSNSDFGGGATARALAYKKNQLQLYYNIFSTSPFGTRIVNDPDNTFSLGTAITTNLQRFGR